MIIKDLFILNINTTMISASLISQMVKDKIWHLLNVAVSQLMLTIVTD